MRLLVYDITGNNAMTREAGEAVYDIIHPLLLEKQPVELDFTGVHRYLTVFFNFSVGQLYGDVDADILSSLLKVAGLNSVGEKVLDRVRDNAKRYYSDQNYRQAVDSLNAEQSIYL